LTLEEAASIPLVALTAYQTLVAGGVKKGSTEGKLILIHAGAGGVGSVAIQMAKHHFGLQVATTCSARNIDFVKSLGADIAIDYNKDNYIDLKNPKDAFASAANYLNNMGWSVNSHCFYKIKISEDISKKYLNVSAKKLKNKKKLKYFKKYILNSESLESVNENLKVAIITPDKDIVPNSKTLSPAYVVFDNYEIILKWNRSLRFALAVCTLKNKIKNEL